MNRNSWSAIAATLAVAVVVGLGLHFLGGPGTQRLARADEVRVRALAQLAQHVWQNWHDSSALPANLDKLPANAKQDPLTKQPFVYRAKSGSEYELCATFATDNHDREVQNPANPDAWLHPKGDYCFQMNAANAVPNSPYYYY